MGSATQLTQDHDWTHLRPRVAFATRAAVLDLAVRTAHPIPGHIIEFGVARGTSTRVLRASLTRCERGQISGARKKIFACDSFKGLPEKFETLTVGSLACNPPRIRGVEIVVGYFADSLTPELAHRVGSVSLASFDADLYSSTLCALRWVTPLLHTGSLLLFDEFLGERESEKRAFEEWSTISGVRTIQIAEFLRSPSGGSSASPDKRILVQVIETDERRPRQIVSVQTLLQAMRRRVAVRARLRRLLGNGPQRNERSMHGLGTRKSERPIDLR
jgi:hypothetical protein